MTLSIYYMQLVGFAWLDRLFMCLLSAQLYHSFIFQAGTAKGKYINRINVFKMKQIIVIV